MVETEDDEGEVSEEDEAAELEEEKEGAAAAKQAKHQPKQPSKVGRCCQLHTYLHRTDTHTRTHAHAHACIHTKHEILLCTVCMYVHITVRVVLHWTTALSAHVLTYTVRRCTVA